MTELEIDLAGDADREWCTRLMASSEPWLTLDRDFAACLARCRAPELAALVARRAGEPCGFVLLHPAGVAGSPYIASIATGAAVRGQGVGSALLEAAERRFPRARGRKGKATADRRHVHIRAFELPRRSPRGTLNRRGVLWSRSM